MKIKFISKNKIVALEKGKMVGYVKFHHPDHIYGKRNLLIDYVYVKPSYRRKGIATQMLKLFLDNFKNKNIVWVNLWTGDETENDKAFSLYKKLGFKELAFEPDYYKKGVGTRLFAKRISKNF